MAPPPSLWSTGSLDNPSREVQGDTIMFHSVQMGGSAVYQCNASNQYGYLLANALVSVLGEWAGPGGVWAGPGVGRGGVGAVSS